MELAKNIIRRCQQKGLSLSQLARLSGVKQPTLHGWTTGRAVHNLDHLKLVCDVLETSVHELLFGCPDPFESKTISLNEIFSGELQITVHRIIKSETKKFLIFQN